MLSWSFPRTPENSRGGVEAEQSCAEISTDRKKIVEPSRNRRGNQQETRLWLSHQPEQEGQVFHSPEQQQQQEEEEENEFDGIQLLWIEPESSKQVKFELLH